MKPVMSHHDPSLKLAEHIAQVQAAADAVWSGHSSQLRQRCREPWIWVREGVRLHDAGKGSAAFQAYIKNPGAYRGTRLSKAHTPLSFLLAVHYGKGKRWDWRRRFAVAVLAGCHHKGLMTADINGLDNILANGEIADVLVEQVGSLEWSALESALGLTLPHFDASLTVCNEGLDALDDDLIEELRRQPLGNAVAYRLECQLAFSILLEADKAFLAVRPEHLPRYLACRQHELPPASVDRLLTTKPATPLDGLRVKAREEMLDGLSRAVPVRMHTLTLPTGAGKTLLAASWALLLREHLARDGTAPKIIVVLPYLSIIDQTQKEYRDLFADYLGDGLLTPFHSLSERVFDPESGLDSNTNDFFLDTWQSDVVITTFDQLLFALMDPRARYQMRFHNLVDCLIVMDEVQMLPCRLWNPLSTLLEGLTALGQTHVLAMSATQPGFLNPDAASELIAKPEEIFARCARYRLKLRLRERLPIEEFLEEILERARDWDGRRILLVFNTRSCARQVWDALKKAEIGPLYFITADVTPRDRLNRIDAIKEGRPCVVVATQCIEAGVDIDMGCVIRDFAPLDSLIQVAGRCNRHAARSREVVEVVSLLDDQRKPYAAKIYDKVLLQTTRKVLGEMDTLEEEDVYDLTRAWFDELHRDKDLGHTVTRAWAYWQECDPVRELLRGKQTRQESFVVLEEDPTLYRELEVVAALSDRWKRRRAHRAVASRLARVTVSIYARPDFDPSRYAERDPTGCHWLLREGFYDGECGLNLNTADQQSDWGALF